MYINISEIKKKIKSFQLQSFIFLYSIKDYVKYKFDCITWTLIDFYFEHTEHVKVFPSW